MTRKEDMMFSQYRDSCQYPCRADAGEGLHDEGDGAEQHHEQAAEDLAQTGNFGASDVVPREDPSRLPGSGPGLGGVSRRLARHRLQLSIAAGRDRRGPSEEICDCGRTPSL